MSVERIAEARGQGEPDAPVLRVQASLDLGTLALRATLSTRSRRVAIVGPSGAGKSTCLRVLAGLERRARGHVEVEGERWLDTERGHDLRPHERSVGWAPQDALLFPHRSVRQNLGWSGAADARIREVAAELEVEELLERRPRNLSGGERQRVALGRALLRAPRLLLLDEPFSALDDRRRERVLAVIDRHLHAAGPVLVIASHDRDAVERLGAERFALADGRLERA